MDFTKTFNSIETAAAAAGYDDNEYRGADGLLYCGKCNTRKQCRVNVFGSDRVVPCMCKCRSEEYAARKQAEELRDRMREIERLREKGFNNDDIRNWTFARDNGSNAKVMQIMRNYVDNFAEFKKSGTGLLLYGNVGTGKTFAAACVANALIDKAISCYMTNFANISNMLFSAFKDKQSIYEELNRFSLLIIDDLAAERKTEYMQEVVFNTIDARSRAGLPMIITTNLTLDELKHPQNITEARCYDRVLEKCFPIEVAGISQRRKKIVESYENNKRLLGI